MTDHPQWTQRAKQLLDESAQQLDGATLSRLNRARHAALAQQRIPQRWLLPAGLASACALLLAVAMWHMQPGAPHVRSTANAPIATAPAADSDMQADDEDLYEDLDFYAWLDAQDQDPEG